MEKGFCTLCKIHCSLDNPKCPEILTDEMIARKMSEPAADNHCPLCKNHCPYTALSCDIGRTTAWRKGKLQPELKESAEVNALR